MGRKKLIATEKVIRKEYGYESVEPKMPRKAPPPEGAVPVRRYAKREEEEKKPGFFSGLLRKKPKTSQEMAGEELSRAADILEGK